MRLHSKLSMIRRLISNKKYRDAYVYEHVRNGIPFQIRALREQRGWTQGTLADAAKKPRNVITRLEDPNYGGLTLKTLFEIASAFDCGLLVKFVPFGRLLREYEDVTPERLAATEIGKEAQALEAWGRSKDREHEEEDQGQSRGKVEAAITDTAGTRTLRLVHNASGPLQPGLFAEKPILKAVPTTIEISKEANATTSPYVAALK